MKPNNLAVKVQEWELSPGLPPTQVGTGPDQLPLSRQEMAAFPDILPPLVQENCTATPGALEDVFMETFAGVVKGLHATGGWKGVTNN